MASTAVGDCENGEGTMAWADGDEYAGQWRKGEQHGRGVLRGRGRSYDGQWQRDRRHSQGAATYANGHGYAGGWVRHCPSGRGEWRFPDGAAWAGAFRRDPGASGALRPRG